MIESVIAYGALSGPLPKAGLIVVALLAAAVLLIGRRRLRAGAMLAALVVCPVLLIASVWHDSQLRTVRDHPFAAVLAALVGIAVVVVAARWLARRPQLLAPLTVFTLPFRVPITSGGTTSNLLVPLYVVIAVGGLAWIGSVWRRERSPYRSRREEQAALAAGPPDPDPGVVDDLPDGPLLRLLARLLAAVLVLYAIQSLYTSDLQTALQNMVFFYVPFALLYRLLRELRWTPELLRTCLLVLVGLGIVFSLVGFVEYATKTILLNPKLVTTNNLHAYFTVNSLFYDPDIFGRFLALVMLLLAAGLLYRRPSRELRLTVLALAIMWVCLLLTLSRSSLGALLVGLAVLAALRWRISRALAVAVAVIVAGAIAVAATPRTFGLTHGANFATSGRGGLVSGGLSLFGDRPGWGWGSGSFSTEYRDHHRNIGTSLSASHTIPITIAAEQGVIGLIVYLALIACAFAVLLRRARGDPVRSAIAAAFIALIFHTLLYADFLEDPTTWVLLAVGAALAATERTRVRRAATAELAAAVAAAGRG